MRFVKFSPAHRKAFLSALSESKGEFGAAWFLRMKEIFSPRHREPNLRTFAVLESDSPAAFFATRREVEALVLYFILIKKPLRGKGIGTAIVSHAERLGRKAGAKFLRLDVYSGKPVLAFYKKQGFKAGGTVRFYEEEGDCQTFLYKKLLPTL